MKNLSTITSRKKQKAISKPQKVASIAKATLNANKNKSKQNESSSSGSESFSDVNSISESESIISDASLEQKDVFLKDTYIAIVDPSNEDEDFLIGEVLEDQQNVTSDVLVNLFKKQGSQLTYELSEKNVAVAEYCIINEIDVSEKKQISVGSYSPKLIQMTKQNYKISKELMQLIVATLKDISSDDSEEAGSSDSESDEEQKSELLENGSLSGEDSEDVINNRKKVIVKRQIKTVMRGSGITVSRLTGIVKPHGKPPKQQNLEKTKSSLATNKITNNKNETNKSNKQTLSKANKSKSKVEEVEKQILNNKEDVKSEDDFEMVDQEDDEEEAEENMIVDTSSKQKTNKKQASKKIDKGVTQVGQKRHRQDKSLEQNKEIKNKKQEEDNSVVSSDNDDQPVKKRKISKGKEKIVRQVKEKKIKKVKEPKPKKIKVPKAKKLPTEFKKGKWNPNIQVLDINITKEDPSDECIFDCCIRCNSRNMIRAAVTNNIQLLQNCMDANKQIDDLVSSWSPEVTANALEYIILNNNHEMLEALLHPKLPEKPQVSYESMRSSYYSNRVTKSKYLLNYVESGMVSQMAYGTHVRRVEMTRGNRQGNNAFLQESGYENYSPISLLLKKKFISSLLLQQKATLETYHQLFKLNPSIESVLNDKFQEVVRAGNVELAYDIVKDLIEYQNYGLNKLHMEVLGKQIDSQKIMKVSIVKKCQSMGNITPMHCACINPNPNILKQLLEINYETEVLDSEQRRLVHYAAACTSPGPLQLLIDASAVLTVTDKQGVNCLHVAAYLGRTENVRLILTTSPQLLNSKRKDKLNAMALACRYGYLETIKVLLEFKAKINAGVGPDRMPPICWAAAYGHYDLVKEIIEMKGRVLAKDKFGRSPLIMAIRNGHSKIASLLLQHGSEWDSQDSSHNSALHYAAAYGWMECMDLLLKAGANVNNQNSWKLTPINIAMLKNHLGCVKRLLEEPNVDVNCKDEKGRTLLMLALSTFDQQAKDFVKFLLQKGADVNIVDLQGQAALHFIAQKVPIKQKIQHQVDQEAESEAQIQTYLARLVIEHNADISLKNNKGQTAFALCLNNDNPSLLNLLKHKVSLNSEPNLLFTLAPKLFNVHYQKILFEIMDNDPPTEETMNTLDNSGYNIFLHCINLFMNQYHPILQEIFKKLNYFQVEKGSTNEEDYSLTNEQYFDHKIQSATHNQELTQGARTNIHENMFQQAIEKPYLEFLQKLIEKGVDPRTTVGKKWQVRQEEEKQKQIAEDLIKNGPKLETDEDKVVKRSEIIGNGLFSHQQKTQLNKQQLESEQGSTNAFHLIINFPRPNLVDFLVANGIDPDLPNKEGNTPFNLLCISQNNNMGHKRQFRNKLIELDVRTDYPNRQGKTPFLQYYFSNQQELAFELLDLGANISQMDITGLYALKYDLLRKNMGGISALLNRGANINQVDNRERNLLHHAVNASSATADATFEIEKFLIDKGIEKNLRDCRGRTPLHYAFVKIKNWNIATVIDPIETVSSLCGLKGLEIDVPDNWLKTPLHYASQRAATCSAIYLINLGARPLKKDIFNNTSLGVALLNKHFTYGVLLIQKDKRLRHPVFSESHASMQFKRRRDAELREKILKQKQETTNNGDEDKDVEMKDNNGQDIEQNEGCVKQKQDEKKHRHLFTMNKSRLSNKFQDYEEDYDEEILLKDQPKYTSFERYNQAGSDLVKYDDINGCSIFKLAIRAQQLGLAYLMMNSGYGLMLCIQDAMNEKMFQLVTTLLAKTADDSIVQKKNNKDQNLIHILAINAASCQNDQLGRIFMALKERGVDLSAVDKFGRTALHYAIISQKEQLVRFLLCDELKSQQNVNLIDYEGNSPLTLLLKGTKINQITVLSQHVHSAFNLLVENGADVNIMYNEKVWTQAFNRRNFDMYNLNSNEVGDYMCTFAMNLTRQRLAQSVTQEQYRLGMKTLIQYGAKINIQDSEGRDPLMYAIIHNDKHCIKFILDHKNTGPPNLDYQDILGKSAAHYVVEPLQFGSYENVELLTSLNEHGFKLDLKDIEGNTPYYYTKGQQSGVLKAKLKELLDIREEEDQEMVGLQRQRSVVSAADWPERKVDHVLDSQIFMQIAQEKEERSHEKNFRVPVDKTGHFADSYEVYYGAFNAQDQEEGKSRPWDHYLIKVDLKNGVYGDYVFYKMQLLYDKNRDLYVVFTRWGRIGEDGMNQRTPFNDVEEAKEDYKKMFKSKSANSLEDIANFVKVKNRYNIAHINYVTADHKDYLAPFNYLRCPKSSLDKVVYDLFEEISNVTMYQRAMTHLGINLDSLPMSGIKKEILLQARQLLLQLQVAVKECTKIQAEGIKANYDELVAVKDKISDLSSAYYELIPMTQYANSIAPPLSKEAQISKQLETLDSLSFIGQASKILIGALFRQTEINPIDYVFDSLNIRVEALDKESGEYDLLHRYLVNTGASIQHGYELNIFKLQRHGEVETMDEFCKEIGNRTLLLHGSQIFNFMGILSEGLRIAPPEAPPTGHLLGKGVYFGDTYSKSCQYSRKYHAAQDSELMLMCEVALGNQMELYSHKYIEQLEATEFNSVKGVGRSGPDPDKAVIMPNGIKVPHAKIVQTVQPVEMGVFKEDGKFVKEPVEIAKAINFQWGFQSNEYVVYNTNQVRMKYLVQITRVKQNIVR